MYPIYPSMDSQRPDMTKQLSTHTYMLPLIKQRSSFAIHEASHLLLQRVFSSENQSLMFLIPRVNT